MWQGTITSINNDPDNPQNINIVVSYTNGSDQTVEETYTYNSINLTDPQQVADQIQSRLSAFTAFDSIVQQLNSQIGQAVPLAGQDSGIVTADPIMKRPVSLSVGNVGEVS